MSKILLLDLEATCDDGVKNYPKEKREIIEIGAVVSDYDGNTYDEFSLFVKPVIIETLSQFCTELTSIKQEQVDEAPLIKDAFIALNTFCNNIKTIHPELVGWGSWGYYDKGKLEYDVKNINRIENFNLNILNWEYHNISDIYYKSKKLPRKVGLGRALTSNGLSFIGTAHRGIDDVKNIARLLPITFKRKNI